jgi:Zn-dependent protease with chaperone function
MSAAPIDTAAPLAGRYFDGKTSRAHQVTLRVTGELALLEGEVQRQCALQDLRVSARSRHAARKVTFADGAYLEIDERAAFDILLHETGYRDSWVVRMQQSWRGAFVAAVASAAALAVFYYLVLPQASNALARMLPLAVERQLGSGLLALLDGRLLGPTGLAPARQQQLVDAFVRMRPARPRTPPYRIIFRSSKIGPNAFALPSGDIIMTDELVKLMPDDEAVIGVLAHELGHLHERHLTRRLIQSSAIAATATLLFGDVSAIVANVPTVMLDLKYSRDTERAADAYAIAMLDMNGIAREHLAQAFLQLQKLDKEDSPYLSSHPPSAERIAYIRSGTP